METSLKWALLNLIAMLITQAINVQKMTAYQLLGVWIHQPCKLGCPQNSTKMHFLTTLKTVLPGISDKGLFKEWYELAKDESHWDSISTYFIEMQWKDRMEAEVEENTDMTEQWTPMRNLWRMVHLKTNKQKPSYVHTMQKKTVFS